MKKMIILSLVLVLAGFVGVSQADLTGDATAHVFAVVNPNVTMSTNTPIVDAGSIQTGDFTATINFGVHANKEAVTLFVEASPLFKGDDPLNSEVLPIPLNFSEGVVIDPANANPMAGADNIADYLGAGANIGDFPTAVTEAIEFESSQNNRFSQDVLVIVTYNQDDPEKPMGEYSGAVRLTALLMP
ncbi:MAG: hypothetical protein ISR96_02990 [Nitrospira sp.]|nr:hypothetical protein [Nitrospira sp.]